MILALLRLANAH